MFAKSKVSQSMIDAVNKVLGEKVEPVQEVKQTEEIKQLDESSPIKEPTKTGMKVFGRSYGNSAKAKQDQTKSSVDTLKGPKDKEMKEDAKPDFLDMDKDGNKKESMKKAIADKGMKEELKGDQHKIDANKNNKIDGQDFEILRKKKVKEGREFTEKLLETVRKSDVPAYLRKAKGDTPLTVADVKGPKKDSISAPENLAKNRNEWKEDVDFTEEQLDEMINEVLGKDATAGDWISDFVHSDNPKFSGKSKAERKKMALGAYYGKQMKKDVKDKSGAVHTPMSRARDLARAAFKKIQKEVK
jgi:hypothetical protein